MLPNPTLTAPRVATSAPLEQVRDIPATQGTDPEFDRARELLRRDDKDTARAIETRCILAKEILRLRDRFSLGQGGDRKSKKHGVILIASQGGFQAKLQAELGLFPAQAQRLLETADYVEQLQQVAAGKPTPYTTGKGRAKEEKVLEPSDEKKKLAAAGLQKFILGEIPASRAWAGVTGEGGRVDAQDGDRKRAPVAPGKQIRDAMHALAKWMPAYGKLPMNERSLLAQTAKKLDLEAMMAPLWNDVADVEVES